MTREEIETRIRERFWSGIDLLNDPPDPDATQLELPTIAVEWEEDGSLKLSNRNAIYFQSRANH